MRKTGGFEFTGTDPEFTGYSVHVQLADPDKLAPGRNYTPNGMYFQSEPGTIAMVDFDGGLFHRSQPVSFDHVQMVLRRVGGTDVEVTALLLATTWTDRSYQATSYRDGHVLLAGDAAHIHSPLGGQGLNLGLGDAMNLGWKLAAVIRDEAADDLLDTYTTERHPVGEKVLEWSRAQVALMRPSQHSRALEGIIRDLIDTHDGATYFAERSWSVTLRYDLGDTHPLIGRSMPDFALADGSKAGELLADGKGLILDFDPEAPLRELAGRWPAQLSYVTSPADEQLGLSAVIVRPDGFVAWATNGAADAGQAADAVSRWFDKPAVTRPDP